MFKKDFPILAQNVTYLDSAATTQKPKVLLHQTDIFYKKEYANVHRGTCALANQATAMYEKAREIVADFIGAESKNIIFTKGATEAINLVASGYAQILKEEDEVLVSIAEHHANFVPWQQACLHSKATFKVFNILPDGRLDMDDFKAKLSDKTKIVAVAHISNVLGVENPIKEIVKYAHEKGAKVLLDTAQSVSHLPISVKDLDVDYLAFSGHKVYAPTGIGVLYGKTECLNELPPYQFGGDMIDEVKVEGTTFALPPAKFEAGTPPITQAIGLAVSLEYLKKIGLDKIQRHEKALMKSLIKGLKKIPDIQFLGDPKYKTALVSFNISGIHPNDLGFILAKENICVRIGHHCAMPLHAYFKMAASLRVSFGLYNTEKDVQTFLKAFHKAIGFFK
ncbi:MAG: aminotransferase class V-fold PLP-dependent enzyme [Alphaproteobacteria bacterium]